MRLTINLSAENYAAVKTLAQAEGCSLSAAVNRLMAETARSRAKSRGVTFKNGLPVSRGAIAVTSEMVREFDNEI
jgi:hypothetical protein